MSSTASSIASEGLGAGERAAHLAAWNDRQDRIVSYDLSLIVARQLRAHADDGDIESADRLSRALLGQVVVKVHTHKEGYGDGTWFRLATGDVIDGFGERDDPDAVYDSVPN
jgi:hypothetical protein